MIFKTDREIFRMLCNDICHIKRKQSKLVKKFIFKNHFEKSFEARTINAMHFHFNGMN